MQNTTTTVEVKGHKYQIEVFDSFDGAWLAILIGSKIMPFGMGDFIQAELPSNRLPMTKQEFQDILDHCLSIVYRFHRTENPTNPLQSVEALVPVYTKQSRSFNPLFLELKNDTVAVLALAGHVLKHNITPFFSEENKALLLSMVEQVASL